LATQLGYRESGVEPFVAKLGISLTETVNDLPDILKQIGQMKYNWFATA